LESSTHKAWSRHHGTWSSATSTSKMTMKPEPEQVLGRVQAPPTSRRRGSKAPEHKRAQKTRLGNTAAWCMTGQRTKRRTTRAPTCSILRKGGVSRQRWGIDPTGKGAAGGPDATSRADAQREDNRKGNQATTTGQRPGFLRPPDKPRATTAVRLHHHS
jgi:hypothetical protein